MTKTDNQNVRVRIAPSPTGAMHIGTARTALFNWLFARKHGGTFIVRIEDTDKERSTKEFEANIIEGLRWLGLTPDDGQFPRQSERAAIHREHLERLLREKKAFWCEHTTAELEAEGERQRAAKEPPRHQCSHRNEERTNGIVRFKNDTTQPIIVRDMVRGEVTYDPQLLGDFSLAKSLDAPLYNFVVVVDDHDMHITHVIRGEDHLSNTPKQILIGQALGYEEPAWAHIPLLLGNDRSKLSKRHGALSVLEYRELGYLPEALINFIALLGWHPKDEAGEVLDRDALVKEFDLARVQKSGAVVSLEKLDWFNRAYLAKLSPEALRAAVEPFLKKRDEQTRALPDEKLEFALSLIRERASRLSDFQTQIEQIWGDLPEYPKELLLWKGKLELHAAGAILDELIKVFSDIDPSLLALETIKAAIEPLTEKHGKGSVLWPLRAALSGKEASLGPYELAFLLGHPETIRRLEAARNLLKE